jgi:Fur family transcriptional regulator, ferric uptake regulator
VAEGGQTGVADLPGRLAEKGIRSTSQRLRVLELLSREPADATAQEIYARLRDQGRGIGLATVYRTLALLSESGVIDALAHRPGEMCYRLCDEGHHHHLLCSRCHRVVELADCELDPWLDRVASDHGFVATDHRLEVTGICAECRSPTSPPEEPTM